MNTQAIQTVGRQLGKTLNANSPTILTGLAVAGLLSTIVLAVKATPRALELIEDAELIESKDPNYRDHIKPLTKAEIVAVTWKCYIPTAGMAALTIGCIVGANSINLRRNAALASLYSLAEGSLKEYQEQVIETIGKNKEQAIRDEIAQKKLDKNPVTNNQVIITNGGDMLCYESLSDRYFTNDIENIRRAQNDFNKALLNDGTGSLNDFYYLIGLKPVGMGKDIGWNIEQQQLDIAFSSKLTNETKPCLVLTYRTPPVQIR